MPGIVRAKSKRKTTERPAAKVNSSAKLAASARSPKASSRRGLLSQRDLESAILKQCAVGRDKLDRPDRNMPVRVSKVLPGATGSPEFPRAWARKSEAARGCAEWYVPEGSVDPSRRMLFLHGGSYTVWAPCDAPYRSICSRLALACRVCVLSIDYRMAPEHLFPAAFEDGLAALKWIAAYGPGSATEPAPARDVFVCGDSAGGGLALALCAATLPQNVRGVLRGVVGISAWADMTASVPSYETRQWDATRCFGDPCNAGVDRQAGREEAEVYLGRDGVRKHGKDWRASPFFASKARLLAMPAVLLHVGDYELIRDESKLLGDKLRAAGHGDSTVKVYPRMWHCWHEYSQGSGFGQPLVKAVRAVNEIGKWVKHRKST